MFSLAFEPPKQLIVPAWLTDALEWIAFAVSVVLFNAGRAVVYLRIQLEGRHALIGYPIVFGQLFLGGSVAPVYLRRFALPALDWIAFALHLSHFGFFLFFVVFAWLVDRRAGRWTQRALVVVFVVGLLGYYLVPTAPPWMAAADGLIPFVPHVAHDLYLRWFTDGTVTMLDTNPIAAMPSLHVAFPAACAVIGTACFSRRIWIGLCVYTVAQSLGVMYLGEHYLIDVIAGLLVGWIAARVTEPRRPVEMF